MKITGYGPITTPGRATRPGAAQGRFRLPGNGAAGAASEATRDAGAAEGVSIAASLIALQETMLAAERDREARARADRMLEELAELQRGILGGRLSAARLRELAALADQPGVAADGRLAEIVGAITLRARVELARLELAAAGGVANGG